MSTGTHGSTLKYGSLSSQVTAGSCVSTDLRGRSVAGKPLLCLPPASSQSMFTLSEKRNAGGGYRCCIGEWHAGHCDSRVSPTPLQSSAGKHLEALLTY